MKPGDGDPARSASGDGLASDDVGAGVRVPADRREEPGETSGQPLAEPPAVEWPVAVPDVEASAETSVVEPLAERPEETLAVETVAELRPDEPHVAAPPGGSEEAEQGWAADGPEGMTEATGGWEIGSGVEMANEMAYRPRPSPVHLLAVTLGAAVLMAAAGWLLAWLAGAQPLAAYLRLPVTPLRLVGWSVLGVAVSLGSTWLLTVLWPQFGSVLEDTGLQVAEDVLQSLGPWRMTLLVSVSAVGEEVFFRGGLQPVVGLVPAALAFGLAHGGWRPRQFWAYAVAATLAGAIFGEVFAVSGSLWVPVIAHVLHNVAVTTYVARKGLSGEVQQE